MQLESDSLRLRELKAVGGFTVLTETGGEFTAVWDNAYVGMDAGEVDVESREPMLTCRSSDVAALSLSKLSVLTVGERSYRLRRHEPDGTGMSRLILEVA